MSSAIEAINAEFVNALPLFQQDLTHQKTFRYDLPYLDDLTESQKGIFRQLVEFVLHKKPHSRIRLNGYAGTGKTFVMSRLAKFLATECYISIVIASPTNEAKRNAQSMLEDIEVDHLVQCVTVAQLLGLQPVINDQSGVIEFKQQNREGIVDVNAFDVIFIDESSMINENDFKLIQETIYKPVIFVGDQDQLPPVNEPKSKVYLTRMEDAFLTEIVRYDGEVARVAEEIRSNPLYRCQIYPFKSSEDGSIEVCDSQSFINKAVAIFKSQDYQENFSECALACWRNDTVKDFNTLIREEIWGNNCPEYLIGDRLIARQPIMRKIAGKSRPQVLFNNSERLVVTGDFGSETHDGLAYFTVPVQVWGGVEEGVLRVITPFSEDELETRLKTLRDIALDYKKRFPSGKNPYWKDYYALKEFFDNVAFAYARTTHKLQGSSINHLFLCARDYRGNTSEKQALQYTALTRTKKKVFVLM